jgi:hypothetical protein
LLVASRCFNVVIKLIHCSRVLRKNEPLANEVQRFKPEEGNPAREIRHLLPANGQNLARAC